MSDEDYINNILDGGSSDQHYTNNVVGSTVDVNNAEAIFIPSDIEGDRTNYTEYKVGWYRSVPANCALVRRNIITGHLSLVSGRDDDGKIVGGGFHFMPPFITKSIFVPLIDRTIDYPKADYLTKDNIYANVDIVLKVRITDPVNYLNFGRHQLDNLNTLTQNLLRDFIRRHDYDELSSGRINLDEFDPKLPGQNGGVPESAYEDFEKRYGIEVKSIQLKSIKLPENLQKLYDDVKEEEKKKAAQQIRLAAEKERAEAEARMMDIRTEAEARRARQLAGAPIQGLKEQGISSGAIEQNVGVFGAKNSVYIGGANGNGTDTAKGVAAGIVAGNTASQTNNQDKHVDRIQNLMNLIDLVIKSGMVSQGAIDSYNTLRNSLSTNMELVDLINGFPEEQYSQITQYILSGNMGGFSLDGSKGRSRGR